MQDIINYIKDQSVIVIIIICLLLIVVYTMTSVLLNNLNNVKYGKTTILAWIPAFNIYLLGKLVLHAIFGLLLFIALLFGIGISFKIKGLEMIYNLLPKDYVLIYQIGYVTIVLIMFIFAKLKLNKIIRDGTGKDMMNLFVNKDFEKKDPEIIVNNKPKVQVEESIRDNFQYNSSPLNDLKNNSNNNIKNNDQNP